ncbi:MAG: MgtC/SapB family protein [Candidatus Omnitrophica bacterium]|nr:MgtC/SapB family protein [Candidatus Omnitrophota bacterium]
MGDIKTIVCRLILTMVLSGLIGVERETHGRAAGLRTHILVGVSSTLILLTSIYMAETAIGGASIDPGRVAAGVITGIGFIGAGTIIRFRASVKGLTTAAGLWATAGVGLAVGCGFYTGAFAATFLILFSLVFLGRFEKRVIKKIRYGSLEVKTSVSAEQFKQIRAILSDYKVRIKDLEIDKLEEPEMIKLIVDVELSGGREDEQIINDLMKIEGVRKAAWFKKEREVKENV